jgi:hypothetical protein
MTNVMDAKGRAGKDVSVAGEQESGGLSASRQAKSDCHKPDGRTFREPSSRHE